MERRIDPDAPLDYVELQIFPSHNRYEACVSTSNTAEKVASGDLEELLLHLPQVKDLSSKNSNSNFKILAPEDVNDTDWFTAATLSRFLLIVGSPDILTIGNEISQLEETRKFQLSLFAKAEFDMTSSFESKNELLRTVDLRLSELKEKLSDTLHQATGNKCSPKDISNIENLAHHLGAENIRDSLQKLLEPSHLKDSITERNIHIPNSQLSPPVKYGVSPAKAAQIERQLSTDSESSNSFSSEEDNQPPPIERSRTPSRPSAASRRSASPMRRIQIGRGGPRRPTVLNIKSLNYPKSGTQRDGSESGQSSQEEEDEKSEKLRMSVQDKISLFESKKKDEGVEIQKPKTLQIQKAVLRRWSSGMSESHDAEKTKSPSPKKNAVDDHEKDVVVSSWSEQKEAELNQLFNKMMETKTKTKTKPVRRHSVTNDDNSKSKSKEQRGGFYENYKQKRDEKLRKEVGKRAEKEAQLQEMEKQLLDGKKSEIVSKPQKPQKKPNQLPNPKKESPKAVKKITNKPSPSQLPATRKSWPSAPSPTTTTTTRKPQSATPAVRPNPITKSEKPKPQSKTLKVTTQPEPKTTRTKPVIDKKPATVTKIAQTAKPKPRTKAATPTATKKVIKKSSVVPVETKPFLRKGTGGGGAVVIKSKLVAQVSTEEAPVQDKAVVVVETSNECEPPPKLEEALPETYVGDDVAESGHEEAKRESCNEIDVVEEELMISPSAWVVERETDEIVACEERCVQVSSPRVRHSLFQMLLEETGEGESGDWGNAQIPHPSVHKDTHAQPKGFKRLLKFARKTKADLLLTDSSSPSTIFRRG